MEQIYKILVFVPESHFDIVSDATSCIDKVGEYEQVEEEKIEK